MKTLRADKLIQSLASSPIAVKAVHATHKKKDQRPKKGLGGAESARGPEGQGGGPRAQAGGRSASAAAIAAGSTDRTHSSMAKGHSKAKKAKGKRGAKRKKGPRPILAKNAPDAPLSLQLKSRKHFKKDSVEGQQSEELLPGGINEQKTHLKFAAVRMLLRGAQWSEVLDGKRRRLLACGRALSDRVLAGTQGKNGKGKIRGVIRCGQPFCSACATWQATKEKKRIIKAIERFKKRYPKSCVMCLTLTVPRDMGLGYTHDQAALWLENHLLLREAWAYFNSRFTTELRNEISLWSFVKKHEEMFNPGFYIQNSIVAAGCHFHLHIILMLDSLEPMGRGEGELARMICEMWEKAVKASVRKLRKQKKAKLVWIDLRKKHVIEPPMLILDDETQEPKITGGINLFFPKDIASACAYLDKLASELAYSFSKSGESSYPGYMLPALIDTKLKWFAMKSFEFFVLASHGQHKLEFGRIRLQIEDENGVVKKTNLGVDKYLESLFPEDEGTVKDEDEKFIPTHYAHRQTYNSEIFFKKDGQLKLAQALDKPIDELRSAFSFFHKIDDPEYAVQLERSLTFDLKRKLAKTMVEKRGLIDSKFVFEWYFGSDESHREAFRREAKVVEPEPRMSVDFHDEWKKIGPRKGKKAKGKAEKRDVAEIFFDESRIKNGI